jgi:hypothetical protein
MTTSDFRPKVIHPKVPKACPFLPTVPIYDERTLVQIDPSNPQGMKMPKPVSFDVTNCMGSNCGIFDEKERECSLKRKS